MSLYESIQNALENTTSVLRLYNEDAEFLDQEYIEEQRKEELDDDDEGDEVRIWMIWRQRLKGSAYRTAVVGVPHPTVCCERGLT